MPSSRNILRWVSVTCSWTYTCFVLRCCEGVLLYNHYTLAAYTPTWCISSGSEYVAGKLCLSVLVWSSYMDRVISWLFVTWDMSLANYVWRMRQLHKPGVRLDGLVGCLTWDMSLENCTWRLRELHGPVVRLGGSVGCITWDMSPESYAWLFRELHGPVVRFDGLVGCHTQNMSQT